MNNENSTPSPQPQNVEPAKILDQCGERVCRDRLELKGRIKRGIADFLTDQTVSVEFALATGWELLGTVSARYSIKTDLNTATVSRRLIEDCVGEYGYYNVPSATTTENKMFIMKRPQPDSHPELGFFRPTFEFELNGDTDLFYPLANLYPIGMGQSDFTGFYGEFIEIDRLVILTQNPHSQKASHQSLIEHMVGTEPNYIMTAIDLDRKCLRHPKTSKTSLWQRFYIWRHGLPVTITK